MMSSLESFTNSALDLKKLFYTPKDAIYVYETGLLVLFMLLLSVFSIKKIIKTDYKKDYILFLSLGILCTLMATKIFPWKIFGGTFIMLQFTWRILVFSNFFLALVCALNIHNLIKKFEIIDVAFFTFISILCIIPLMQHIPTNSDINDIDQIVIGKVDENKLFAIAGMGKGEYLPVNSNNNRSYIINRENTVCVLDGDVKIKSEEKIGQTLRCELDILEDNTILEFPYIYYPGYKVFMDGNEIDSFESKNGFLSASVPSNTTNAEITVEYTGTIAMKISNCISIIGLVLFFITIYRNIESHNYIRKY